MDPDRLEQLLASYGADERRWPEELRAPMRNALDRHPEARRQLAAARDLDLLLDAWEPEVDDLTLRILDAVPQGYLERLLAWLSPQNPAQLWRPLLAGVTPFVLGMAIGLGNPEVPGLAATESLDWEQQERALLLPATNGDWYE